MAFAVRGVLEGFYGRPWSWPERQRMIRFMGTCGLNLYMYAPKNDPIHRNRWREPYLPEEVSRFADLIRLAREQGVELVFGISPLQFHYSDPADFAVLWGKLLPLYQAGCPSFSVLLDDMPDKFHHADDATRFDSVAAAQVWLNNTLLERLRGLGAPAVKLYFCPTEYCGDGVSPYLEALGAGLDPVIDIFWTGREVCSNVLRTADARAVSATLRRPVLYWDNYPVNDLDMRFEPHITPIKGRDADLGGACRGIVANGGTEPEANKVVFHTYAQYMADPAGYDPGAAWRKALLAVTGDVEDAAAVAVLGDLARESAIERHHHLDNFLLPAIRRFWERWGGEPELAGPDLPDLVRQAPPYTPSGLAVDRRAALAEIGGAYDRICSAAERLLSAEFRNKYLQTELRPWSVKMKGWARLGLMALELLNLALNDPHDPAIAVMRDQVLDKLLLTRENFAWVQGDLTDQFARRCLWAADALKGEA